MKSPVAMLLLGSIAIAASAAESDIHGFVDASTGRTRISVNTDLRISRYLHTRGRIFRPWNAGFGH